MDGVRNCLVYKSQPTLRFLVLAFLLAKLPLIIHVEVLQVVS
jgi:hypothetical protein